MKINLSELINTARMAMLDNPQEYHNEFVLAEFPAPNGASVKVILYKRYADINGAIDLRYETKGGLSYYPIRYENGKVAYDFPLYHGSKLQEATIAAYDFLLKHGQRAHSDFYIKEA